MPPISINVKDYLDQDQPIRGQNYVCMSFLSPNDAIASKDAFAVGKFLGAFSSEASKVFEEAEKRCSEEDKTVINNLRERYAYIFDRATLAAEFDMYTNTYSKEITDDYDKASDNECSIRGIKIRGAYETIKEAQERAEKLKRQDPNFSVYVCEMGCWCPWSPSPDEIKDAEYSESQLNSLMKKYKENMALRDDLYESRKREFLASGKKDASVEEIAANEADGFSPSVGSQDEEPPRVTDISAMINEPAPATMSSPAL
jgi:hypothetical protein